MMLTRSSEQDIVDGYTDMVQLSLQITLGHVVAINKLMDNNFFGMRTQQMKVSIIHQLSSKGSMLLLIMLWRIVVCV